MKNLRKCVSCGQLKTKENLIKVTCQTSTGAVFINPDTKIFGRSAYLCYNNECIETAIKKNRIQRAIRHSIKEDLSEVLKGKL